MVNSSENPEFLLTQMRQGKTETFGRIYREYIDRIYRFIYLKVATKEDGEDLTSQTFFRALEYLARPDAQVENLQAFLYRVARNQVIDYYRARGQWQSSLEVGELAEQVPDASLDLALEFDKKLDVETVRQALKAVNPDYQDVIIWYYVEEQTIAEIGQILEKSQGAVRILIFRAIRSLKEQLNKNVK